MNFIRRAVPQLRCVAAARSLTAGPVVSAAKGSGGEVTHTGQAYAEADYKNARFNGLKKDVNPNWAEKMIAEEPVIVSHKRVVSCDGGGGALGHPKVFINLDEVGVPVPCKYCGLQFVLEAHH